LPSCHLHTAPSFCRAHGHDRSLALCVNVSDTHSVASHYVSDPAPRTPVPILVPFTVTDTPGHDLWGTWLVILMGSPYSTRSTSCRIGSPEGQGLLASTFSRSFPLIYKITSGFLVNNLVIKHHERERGHDFRNRIRFPQSADIRYLSYIINALTPLFHYWKIKLNTCLNTVFGLGNSSHLRIEKLDRAVRADTNSCVLARAPAHLLRL